MNEWDLQNSLSKYWRDNALLFESEYFKLICWELMFPSWSINDNKRKWNEISIDFIFYAQESKTFICGELKNVIKSRKELLSAYCQTITRSMEFTRQYSCEKMNSAMKECFSNSSNERGGVTKKETINFSAKPNVKMILFAYKFPKNTYETIRRWNRMTFEEIIDLVETYSENKEFKRFKKVDKLDFIRFRNVYLEEIKLFSTNTQLLK